MIVVDVNVVAYLLIEGDRTSEARQAWHRDGDWRCPALLVHEFLNVLATYQREAGLDLPHALELLRYCRNLFRGREHDVPGEVTLRVAAAQTLSAYDSQYLALAESLDTQLLTEDRALLRSGSGRAVSLTDFLG